MSTIYILTEGEYSDYRILAAFDDKAKAEAAAELWREGDSIPDIEELKVNQVPDHPPGLLPFTVIMDRDGNSSVGRHSISGCGYLKDRPDEKWGLHPTVKAPGRHEYRKTGLYRFYTWAMDEKHAVKIANERRAQLIAANQWPSEGFDMAATV